MKSSFPSRAIIELHYDCNLKCQTCNIWREEFKSKRMVSRKLESRDIYIIQRKLSLFGIKQVALLGGEPFLHPRIFSLIKIFHVAGISTAVVTNGSNLSLVSMEKILKSGLDTLIFSLDGPADIHDALRGKKGLFKDVVRRITWIQREKKIRKKNLPKVHVYTTISSKNFFFLSAMMEIIQKLDVNAVRFQLVSVVKPEIIDQTNKIFQKDVVGYHGYSVDPELMLDASDLSRVKDVIDGFALWSRKVGIKIIVENCLRKSGFIDRCQFIDRSFVLTPSGDIHPCPMLTRYSAGSLYRDDLKTIWRSEKIKLLRSILDQEKYLPICRQCCVEKMVTNPSVF